MDFFDYIKDSFSDIVNSILEVLPKSPIVFIQTIPEVEKYMGMLNWFIPIYTMISIVEAWLIAIATYYFVQVILRWCKVVE